MKALFIKDLYALKESRLIMLLTLVLSIIVGCMGNIAFINGYVCAIALVLVLNVIAYDETDNGYVFLFTLPISRKQYVMEKYIFAWMTACAGWCMALILSSLVASFSSDSQVSGELQWLAWGKTMTAFYGCGLALMLVMQAILIPIQLRFGGQRGRAASLLAFAMIFGAAVLVAKLIGSTVDDGIERILDLILGGSIPQTLGACLVIFLVSSAISFFCSVRIMERKKF